MKLTELPLFFLDLQTTGAKPDSGAFILEAAWAELEGEVQSALVQLPGEEKIPYRIQILTGIFNEDLEAAVPLAEVFANLKKYHGRSAIIHFAQFEKPFLTDAFQRIGEDPFFDILCTHEIAKRLFPNLPTRGIKGLAGYFGFPSVDLKRSAHQVEATRVIWKGLATALQEKGIHTLDELKAWLQETPKVARTKYEYPLPKDKRLTLPDQPGVYRMVSKWDEILYVGKATSLKDRVNSYFRGQKNRDSRKLEMLTQVYDLKVTVCGSPLEAALLETDEIKRLDPRYNISLKAGHRSLVFFNREMTDIEFEQNEEFRIGPFSTSMVFESIRNLSACLMSGEFHDNIFYDEIEGQIVKEGVAIFCERYGIDLAKFRSVRTMISLGLWWNRQYEIEEEDVTDEEESQESSEEEVVEEIAYTPELVAEKIERHIMRAGQTYLRAKELTRMLNADVKFLSYELKTRRGHVASEVDSARVAKVGLWQGLDINTYDRMSVLAMELAKIKKREGVVEIQYL
ncbi:MAG: GIY-YIG nuclease family protein [Bdellovibrio sp.]|nr:GIY-YIG nuclease family protein [Bdellovibrio sp.]